MFRQALASSTRPAARVAALQRGTVAQTRLASGGSSYNQPTGLLFGEKVSLSTTALDDRAFVQRLLHEKDPLS